jgi:hypothetical protein
MAGVNVRASVAQGADEIVQFRDRISGLTGATAITFDVWQDSISGTNLISKSLGAGITVVSDTACNIALSRVDTAIAAGSHWFELWVTTSAGDRTRAAFGSFRVMDARKHD